MTELYRFTIEEQNGKQEYIHEMYVKANSLMAATDAAVEYTSTFYQPAVQDKHEDGSLFWRAPGGEKEWEIGSITPIAFIAITPVNAPVIYIPVPVLAPEES